MITLELPGYATSSAISTRVDIICAVRGLEVSCLGAGITGNGAYAGSMQGSQVGCLIVGAFQDIYLSVIRPCTVANGPERGPSAADPSRHMGNICNEETMVVFLRAGDPDTRSTDSVDVVVWLSRVVGVGRVDADNDGAIGAGLDQATTLGGRFIDIAVYDQCTYFEKGQLVIRDETMAGVGILSRYQLS